MPRFAAPESLDQAMDRRRRLLREGDDITDRIAGRPEADTEAYRDWRRELERRRAAIKSEVKFVGEWITQRTHNATVRIRELEAENARLGAENARLRAELAAAAAAAAAVRQTDRETKEPEP